MSGAWQRLPVNYPFPNLKASVGPGNCQVIYQMISVSISDVAKGPVLALRHLRGHALRNAVRKCISSGAAGSAHVGVVLIKRFSPTPRSSPSEAAR